VQRLASCKAGAEDETEATEAAAAEAVATEAVVEAVDVRVCRTLTWATRSPDHRWLGSMAKSLNGFAATGAIVWAM
jgi:hypothetical protein